MAKYDALAHNLSQVAGDTAELDFTEFAEIVAGLPASAYAERSGGRTRPTTRTRTLPGG